MPNMGKQILQDSTCTRDMELADYYSLSGRVIARGWGWGGGMATHYPAHTGSVMEDE